MISLIPSSHLSDVQIDGVFKGRLSHLFFFTVKKYSLCSSGIETISSSSISDILIIIYLNKVLWFFKPRFMLRWEAVTVIPLKYCSIHVVMAFVLLILWRWKSLPGDARNVSLYGTETGSGARGLILWNAGVRETYRLRLISLRNAAVK